MKYVGRVPLAELERGPVRLDYPPFDVMVALVDGVPYAIEDACNHAGASLSEGPIENGCVTCPQHGYVFSLLDGHLVVPKGICDDQRTFVTKTEGDDVVVYDDALLTIVR